MKSSMYNSILHFNEFGAKKIEETIQDFLKEGKDIADFPSLGVNTINL